MPQIEVITKKVVAGIKIKWNEMTLLGSFLVEKFYIKLFKDFNDVEHKNIAIVVV